LIFPKGIRFSENHKVQTVRKATQMEQEGVEGREAELFAAVGAYQTAARENYSRIRALAEAIRAGFCAYIASANPPCVLLVPPAGPFEPKDHGDGAFSAQPQGLITLQPIAFGLAIRLTPEGNWMRQTFICHKEGQQFTVKVEGGPTHQFGLPLHQQDPQIFFEALYDHILSHFEEAVRNYEEGETDAREIGFDFFPALGHPVKPA
jgi:hypothetical protein